MTKNQKKSVNTKNIVFSKPVQMFTPPGRPVDRVKRNSSLLVDWLVWEAVILCTGLSMLHECVATVGAVVRWFVGSECSPQQARCGGGGGGGGGSGGGGRRRHSAIWPVYDSDYEAFVAPGRGPGGSTSAACYHYAYNV